MTTTPRKTHATPIKLQDLRAFCMVLDHGSISAAATALGEAKGSVSRRLTRLEQTVGMALVLRTGGPTRPTTEGIAYRRRIGDALEQIDSATTGLHENDGHPRGHLRVTALPAVGSTYLGGLAGRFAEAVPGVTLEMILTERRLSFRDDRIDFAIRIALGQPPDSGHKALMLADIQIVMAATRPYLERHGTPTHPSMLKDHRMLVPPAREGGMQVQLHPVGEPEARESYRFDGHLLSHDLQFLQAAAQADGGILVSTEQAIAGDDTLIRVLPNWVFAERSRMQLIYPAGRLTPKAQAFRDFVRAEFSHSKES